MGAPRAQRVSSSAFSRKDYLALGLLRTGSVRTEGRCQPALPQRRGLPTSGRRVAPGRGPCTRQPLPGPAPLPWPGSQQSHWAASASSTCSSRARCLSTRAGARGGLPGPGEWAQPSRALAEAQKPDCPGMPGPGPQLSPVCAPQRAPTLLPATGAHPMPSARPRQCKSPAPSPNFAPQQEGSASRWKAGRGPGCPPSKGRPEGGSLWL